MFEPHKKFNHATVFGGVDNSPSEEEYSENEITNTII